MKLNRKQLRNLIMIEVNKSIEEEALYSKDSYQGYGMLSRHDDPGRQAMHQSCAECGYKMSVYEGEKGVCEQCGSSSMIREGKSGLCEQCGTSSMVYEGEKGVCEQCGYSTMEAETQKEYMNEGACGGCGSCGPCGEDEDTSDDYESGDYEVLDYDSDDDFIPDHMQGQGGHDFDVMQKAMFDRFPHMKNIHVEFEDDVKVGNHKHYKGSYMAKSHLYKVNKYAEKLYQMIPDGHNLEDWMRTKLAQIADDIGEVYHALDHDKFEGDI